MEPLKSLKTKDYVAQMLREEIFSGALKDQEELTQELLAEKLGVSRTPVREALLQLELEGYLTRLPNRHLRVSGITPAYIKQNFSVLAAIEQQMAAIAFDEGRDLRLALVAAQSCQSVEQELEIHRKLCACLENPGLTKVHDQLLSGYFSYSLQNNQPDKTRVTVISRLAHALEEKNLPALQAALHDYFIVAANSAIGGIPRE